MDEHEFWDCLYKGYRIECHSIEEKKNVIQFLYDEGLSIGENTMKCLRDEDNFLYPHPKWNGEFIHSTRSRTEPFIRYPDIEHIIKVRDYSNLQPINTLYESVVL